MAGTIIADYIRTDANKLSLNVGNVTFATINAGGFYSNTGVQIINQNGQISADSIQTGNLNASLLTNGTVPKGRFPSGTVLQVVPVRTTTRSETSSTSFQNTGLSTSFTPVSATSTIILMADISVNVPQGHPKGMLARFYDSTGAAALGQEFNLVRYDWQISGATMSGYYAYTRSIMQHSFSSWGTTSKTLIVQFRNFEQGTVVINETYPSTQSSGFTIMEIAG